MLPNLSPNPTWSQSQAQDQVAASPNEPKGNIFLHFKPNLTQPAPDIVPPRN